MYDKLDKQDLLDFYYRYFKRLNEDVLDEDLFCVKASVWVQESKAKSGDFETEMYAQGESPCYLEPVTVTSYTQFSGT